MKSTNKIIIIGIIAGLLLVGVALLNGFLPASRDRHPPCDQLPSVAEATAALDAPQIWLRRSKRWLPVLLLRWAGPVLMIRTGG